MKKFLYSTGGLITGLALGWLLLCFPTGWLDQLDPHSKVVSEQETKIEELQEQNSILQQERDEIYAEYSILRDELWNLNNNLEKETNQ